VELDEEEDFSLPLDELSLLESFLDSFGESEVVLDSEEGFEPFSPLASALPLRA